VALHEIVSQEEAEAVEAAITEAMAAHGLDPSSALDRHVMARLLELGIVPMPGEGSSLH
jgi:hypothetical protein